MCIGKAQGNCLALPAVLAKRGLGALQVPRDPLALLLGGCQNVGGERIRFVAGELANAPAICDLTLKLAQLVQRAFVGVAQLTAWIDSVN